VAELARLHRVPKGFSDKPELDSHRRRLLFLLLLVHCFYYWKIKMNNSSIMVGMGSG